MHTPERISLHELPVLLGHLGDLVLADEGVAADQGWRGDQPPPAGGSGVLLVPPQRVVVAVGHRPRGGRRRRRACGSAAAPGGVRGRRSGARKRVIPSSVMVPSATTRILYELLRRCPRRSLASVRPGMERRLAEHQGLHPRVHRHHRAQPGSLHAPHDGELEPDRAKRSGTSSATACGASSARPASGRRS